MQRRYIKVLMTVLLMLAMVSTYAVYPGSGAVYAASKKVPVKSITLKYKNIKLNNGIYTLKKGKSLKLNAVISPKKVAGKANVVWKSSNQKIVSVTKQGKIKAKKAGKATVIATVKGTKKKAKVTIYVGTPVKKVTVSKSSVTLEQGQTYKIVSKLNPKKPSVKGVKYSSNNKTIATVSSNGVISAVTPGTTTILVKPKDLAGKTAKVTVTVVGKTPSPSPSPSPSLSPSTKYMVSSIELSRYECYIAPGKTVKVDAEVYPENATNKKLTWKSDDTSVATVDQDGLITAIDTGYTYITVAASDGSGIYEEIYVVVKNEYLSVYGMETGISYEDGDTIVMHEGMPTQLEVNAFEQDAEGSINISSEAGASLKIDEYDEYYYYYGDVYRSVVLTPSSGADNKTLTVSYGSFTKTFKLKVYKQFALNFESNGGEALASMTIFEDTKLRLPSPFREKYVFKGWYTDSGFSNKIEDGISLEYNESGYTLYADWEEEYLELQAAGNDIEVEDINTGLSGTYSTNGIIDSITCTVYDENGDEKNTENAIVGVDSWSIDRLGISPGTCTVVIDAVTMAGTSAETKTTITYNRGELDCSVIDENSIIFSDEAEEEPGTPFINNRIDLVFKQGVSKDEIVSFINEAGWEIVGNLNTINLYQVQINSVENEEQMIALIDQIVSEHSDLICSASPEYVEQEMTNYEFVYDDPCLSDFYSDEGLAGNWWYDAIDAQGAWNYANIMKHIYIGVIDSGFNVDHEDLSGGLLFTSYFRRAENKPSDHGTGVASIIKATPANGKGLVGLAWMNRVYAFDYSPDGYQVWHPILKAYDHCTEAVENGCKVINISAGSAGNLKSSSSNLADWEINAKGSIASSVIGQLLERGFDFNVVQAAGNGVGGDGVDAVNNGLFCSVTRNNCYTSYDVTVDDILNRIMVVASAKPDGNGFILRKDSDGGSHVNIAAPGEWISIAYGENQYGTAGQTSAASPIVASVASMVWSINSSFTGAEVQEIVLNSTKYTAKDNPESKYASGSFPLVNAQLAVEEAIRRGASVKGEVSDAETGNGIVATYKIHKNDATGTLVNGGGSGGTTSADGAFTASLPAGKYVFEISASGYVTSLASVVVPVRGNVNMGVISLTKDLNPNAYRVILNWGNAPDDLDSHIRGIDSNNNDSHVYYSNMSEPNLNLDRDDTDQYGPETITISNLGSFTELKYAIHNYSDRYCSSSGENALNLAQSGATVSVFKGNTLLKTFTVPKNKTGTVWTVFSLSRDGTIRPINSMGFESEPSSVLSSSY